MGQRSLTRPVFGYFHILLNPEYTLHALTISTERSATEILSDNESAQGGQPRFRSVTTPPERARCSGVLHQRPNDFFLAERLGLVTIAAVIQQSRHWKYRRWKFNDLTSVVRYT